MIVGRMVVAVGGETGVSTARALVMTWFPVYSGLQSMAMSLSITLPWFASVLCFLLLPLTDNLWGVKISLWIPAVFTAISFGCTLLYAFVLEKYFPPLPSNAVDESPLIKNSQDSDESNSQESSSDSDEFRSLLSSHPDQIHSYDSTSSATEYSSSSSSFVENPTASTTEYSSSSSSSLVNDPNEVRREQPLGETTQSKDICQLDDTNEITVESSSPVEIPAAIVDHSIQMSDINALPIAFWLVCLVNVLVSGALWPFLALSPDFFAEKWHFSGIEAGVCAAVFSLAAIIIAPLSGALMDRWGHRYEIGMIATSMASISFCILGFSNLNPFFGAILLGASLGIISSVIFPLIGIIVSPKVLATAFGITKSIENAGYVIVPFVYGYLADETGSFEIGLALFSALCLFGFALLFILRFALTQHDEEFNSDFNSDFKSDLKTLKAAEVEEVLVGFSSPPVTVDLIDTPVGFSTADESYQSNEIVYHQNAEQQESQTPVSMV
eukprot:CAMPEP_0201560320 /NCGR_PEP_ID=MMETSP0173_2-20130828/78208_1 /ASSEMBLY_ACC=CAM_ASM_000268 /TAXON_ID=218659 /ORGANISM="Vexillifera sp., Strain DIVA3 564/2" /LENGTH=497 /DNA_ID=CAMNT_0047974765 /DNA_START=750 /DNA_END=2243 /DNA_ORIENTATION=-